MHDRLVRTFISVPVPDQVNSIKNRLKNEFYKQKSMIKWEKDDNVHLTLKFIGDMPEQDINHINQIIGQVVSNYTVLKYNISGTGCFPKPDRPRVLWLGVDGELTPLQNLVRNLNQELEKSGYPSETGDFIPHITIARIKYPQKHTPDVTSFLNHQYETIPFGINKIHFMQSQLFVKGSVYTILDTHFLNNN